MDEILKLILGYAIIPIVLGAIAFIMKTANARLERLERQMPDKLNREEVREIVSDKIDPLREDIHELKKQLDRITELLLTRK